MSAIARAVVRPMAAAAFLLVAVPLVFVLSLAFFFVSAVLVTVKFAAHMFIYIRRGG